MSSIFEVGQAYVALSRTRSLHHVRLDCFLEKRIRCSLRVHNFYQALINAQDCMSSAHAEPLSSSIACHDSGVMDASSAASTGSHLLSSPPVNNDDMDGAPSADSDGSSSPAAMVHLAGTSAAAVQGPSSPTALDGMGSSTSGADRPSSPTLTVNIAHQTSTPKHRLPRIAKFYQCMEASLMEERHRVLHAFARCQEHPLRSSRRSTSTTTGSMLTKEQMLQKKLESIEHETMMIKSNMTFYEALAEESEDLRRADVRKH